MCPSEEIKYVQAMYVLYYELYVGRSTLDSWVE